jgi:hypothetical protein
LLFKGMERGMNRGVSIFRHGWLGMLLLLAIAGLNPGGATADESSARKPAGKSSLPTKGVDKSKAARRCAKRTGALAAKRGACPRKQRRSKSGGSGDHGAAPQPAPAFSPGATPASSYVTPPLDPEPLETEPPESEERPPVTPRCELVEGDCSIYSDKFWELLAEYEEFEIGTGVYPVPPYCMKAAAEGLEIFCVQMITFLYPDGTLGGSSWVVDPEAPGGWRLWDESLAE